MFFLSKVLPNSMESLGVEVLKSRGFFSQAYWYWIAVGALVGYVLLLNAGFTLALTFFNREDLDFIHFDIHIHIYIYIKFISSNTVKTIVQRWGSQRLLNRKILKARDVMTDLEKPLGHHLEEIVQVTEQTT
jgi:hypothetical protein